MSSDKFIYKCTYCGKEYYTLEIIYLCPSCSINNNTKSPPEGVLKIVYDYHGVKKKISGFNDLKNKNFIELLPIENINSLPMLRVGKTPLYSIGRLKGINLPFQVHLKDDSQNPTYSFKDRASALVSAFAKEHNSDVLVTASTGNAGSSLAGICATQGQKAIVIVPETAPVAKLTQIIMYGATIVPVKGTYDEAFDLSIKASGEFGWYNRNTAYNPVTIEGKKTVSFELIQELNFRIPDRIFVPVGDGVIISGVYKGFEDLYRLGLIERIPVIVAVQSINSDNLVRNLGKKDFNIIHSDTFADSISVDIPRNFYMAQHFIQQYEGEYITVSDKEILEASAILSKNTGLFSEPAGAAAFAGLLSYYENGKINENSDNVVLLTGSGLKDLRSVEKILKIPQSINPSIENLKNILA
jgi:threonine synthase